MWPLATYSGYSLRPLPHQRGCHHCCSTGSSQGHAKVKSEARRAEPGTVRDAWAVSSLDAYSGSQDGFPYLEDKEMEFKTQAGIAKGIIHVLYTLKP